MLKSTRKRKSEPVTLTFRGLDLCDGCGARLDAGDGLSGLCPVCRAPEATGCGPKHRPRPDR